MLADPDPRPFDTSNGMSNSWPQAKTWQITIMIFDPTDVPMPLSYAELHK